MERSSPRFSFTITDEVHVRVDFQRNRAIVQCKTTDGKLVQLETELNTLDKLHQQIIIAMDRKYLFPNLRLF